MKLEEAIESLDRSAGNASGSSSSIRIKQKFSNILQEVKYKELSPEQLEIVEKELDVILKDLDLEGQNVDHELKKRLKILLDYLRQNFSIVPEGYCSLKGLRLGLSAGFLLMLPLLFYVDSTLNFYTPLAGLIIGFVLGSLCDRFQKSKGRTLLTRMV
jgi:hypothetical protein